MNCLIVLLIVCSFGYSEEEEYELQSKPMKYYMKQYKRIQRKVRKDNHERKFKVPRRYHRIHHHKYHGIDCSGLFTNIDRASDEIDYISKSVRNMIDDEDDESEKVHIMLNEERKDKLKKN